MMGGSLVDRLTAIARRRSRRQRDIAIVRIATIACALLLVFTLIDALLGVAPAIRWAALVVAMALATCAIALVRSNRDVAEGDLLDAARAVDSAVGEPNDTVQIAWRLSHIALGDAAGLREALVKRAVERGVVAIESAPAPSIFIGPALRRSVSRLGLAVLGLVLVSLILPGSLQRAIVRIVDPVHFHPAWASVVFDVQLNPDTIATGDDVDVRIAASAGEGDTWLHVVAGNRAEPERVESIRLDGADVLTARLRDVSGSLSFYIERGRAQSRLHTISPLARPEIAGAVASIERGDASRRIELNLRAMNEITLRDDETLELALSFERTPASIAGASDLDAQIGDRQATLSLDAGRDPSEEFVLTPVGPGGIEAEHPLRVAIRRTGSTTGAPQSPATAGEIASAPPGGGDGPAAQGDSSVARIPGGNETQTVEALPLAEAQALAIERINQRAGAPVGGGRIDPPEAYRALTAQFFRRIVADEDARARREIGETQ